MTGGDTAGGDAPVTFHAALAALAEIDEAIRAARAASAPAPSPSASSEEVLSALLLLRELREQLAGWEPGLIEAAREAGASWAELAQPLGVTSRQAAERRYLRVRPGRPGATGEQRVQATRDRRAADRTVTSWARDNAADLRQLAGQITALDTLTATLRRELREALADIDPARLLEPLTRARTAHPPLPPDLAERVDTVTRRTTALRDESDQRRSGTPQP
ncbi:type III effector protein [Streptomyces sp. CC208A]|uniref:type III effector protein n=1 Tax=Streptomyces sp. CC208A TaxID=3044573 RepID=UPI0024A9AFB8|nr:type III effector protein [Streptomyces sp. CC208A]